MILSFFLRTLHKIYNIGLCKKFIVIIIPIKNYSFISYCNRNWILCYLFILIIIIDIFKKSYNGISCEYSINKWDLNLCILFIIHFIIFLTQPTTRQSVHQWLKQQYEYILYNSKMICIFASGCLNTPPDQPCLNNTTD